MSQKTRLWMIVTGLLCAIVVLYGVFAGLAPQLAVASNTHGLVENTEQLNETQRLQLTMLQGAEDNADELEGELQELQEAIPASAEWAQFLQELQGIEAATGARISGITVEPTILPEVAATDPTAPVEGADAAETDTTVADDAAAVDAEVVDTTAAAPVAVTGLVEMPIAVSLSGDPGQIAEFIRELQTADRLFVARTVEIAAAEGGST